jgi:hypothetical protein
MLAQDPSTGYFHEIPESFAPLPEGAGYGYNGLGEPVYDGFGNPVGFLPGVIGGAGKILGGMMPLPPMQDPSTGYLHEVPESSASVGEAVYDGLGNPVGFLPALTALLPALAPAVGGLFKGLFPSPGVPAPPPTYAPLQPGVTQPGQPWRPPWRPPWPLGWQRPPLPYTGLGPQRMYMRCAVWPGPRGLVPGHALTMMPGAPGAPGMPGAAPGFRRRRRRRR